MFSTLIFGACNRNKSTIEENEVALSIIQMAPPKPGVSIGDIIGTFATRITAKFRDSGFCFKRNPAMLTNSGYPNIRTHVKNCLKVSSYLPSKNP